MPTQACWVTHFSFLCVLSMSWDHSKSHPYTPTSSDFSITKPIVTANRNFSVPLWFKSTSASPFSSTTISPFKNLGTVMKGGTIITWGNLLGGNEQLPKLRGWKQQFPSHLAQVSTTGEQHPLALGHTRFGAHMTRRGLGLYIAIQHDKRKGINSNIHQPPNRKYRCHLHSKVSG